MVRPRVLTLALTLCLVFLGGCTAPKPAPRPAPSAAAAAPAVATIGQLSPGEPQSAIPVEDDDARWGSPTALVTVVAFLDFQCSFCREGYRNLMQLRESYSEDELRIVFKHMPLESHELALPAAITGQAVMLTKGSQAFFSFADKAFSRQSSISYENLALWAGEVGLDRDAYNQTVSDESMIHRIGSDVLIARRLGVDATPTFFVNGRVIGGAQPIEVFRNEIHQELAAMRGAQASQWAAKYRARLTTNLRVSLVETLLSHDPFNYRVPVANSPVLGPADAAVTLVMFTDFECPFCQQVEVTLDRLRERYRGELRIVFKHLPMSFHQSARPAARLSILLYQKKGSAAFYTLAHDLFEAQSSLDEQTLRALGHKHGLSSTEVEQALSGQDDELDRLLAADAELAEDVLVRGTPHFFINGKRLSGARPIEQFEAVVEHELKAAKELLASGVTAKDVYEHLQRDARSPGKPQKVDTVPTAAGHPTRGPENAPVVVHVFSDFECPYCRKGEEMFRRLQQEYPGKLRFVWHDFPLPFHQHALPAARAARQAFAEKGNLGFWRMHDALFALDHEQARVTQEDVLDHAKTIGLNVAQIEKAMTKERYDPDIEADQVLAAELGITGTPAYVIGEYLLRGAGPEQKFRRVIELVLNELPAPPP